MLPLQLRSQSCQLYFHHTISWIIITSSLIQVSIASETSPNLAPEKELTTLTPGANSETVPHKCSSNLQEKTLLYHIGYLFAT